MEIRVFGFLEDIDRDEMRAKIKARVMDFGAKIKSLVISFHDQVDRTLENPSISIDQRVLISEFIEVHPMSGEVFSEQSLAQRLSTIGKNVEVIVFPPITVYINGRIL
ncbi:MAG: hypothetical protein WA064_02205 [Candidatus Moraniibacteriota bacterium]